MFKINNNKQATKASRPRQSHRTVGGDFRRNNFVISSSQRELASRQQSVTQRQLDRKKSIARHRVRVQIAIAVAVVAILLTFIRMSPTDININSNASSKMSDEQRTTYINAIQRLYNDHTLLRQYWLLDHQLFNQDLLQQYPEIEHISLSTSVPFSSMLTADIRFRKAVFMWHDASGATQYVDSNGVLFTKNLDASIDTSKLVVIEDQSGSVSEPGKFVLTKNAVKQIGQAHTVLPQLFSGKSIAKAIIPKATREVQIQIEGVPYVIKFSTERSLDEQVGELRVLLNYMKQQSIVPSIYIDLRVPNKAFYK